MLGINIKLNTVEPKLLLVLGSPGTPGPWFLVSSQQRMEGRYPEINCMQPSFIKRKSTLLERRIREISLEDEVHSLSEERASCQK